MRCLEEIIHLNNKTVEVYTEDNWFWNEADNQWTQPHPRETTVATREELVEILSSRLQ